MKRIALTGGIACGKSLLARYLSREGVEIIDADDVVHALEAPGGAAVAPIRARFGEAVVDASGGIDRHALAGRVFAAGNAGARHDLEDILFPLVRRELHAFFAAPLPAGEEPLRLAIVPLLFESHWDEDYDIIITLVSPQSAQMGRMVHMRGYTCEEAQARIYAQMPLSEKAARADYVVVNDSTPQALEAEAVRLVAWLKSNSNGRENV